MLGEIVVALCFSLIPIVVFLFGLFLFHLIRAPVYIKWEKEKEKRLVISDAEIYKTGNITDTQWLRLRIENPSIIQIPHCYGKLLKRRLVSIPSLVDGHPAQLGVSIEHGQTSAQNRELPPEGHRFPWSPVSLPETEVVISGYGGYEYLYLIAKHNNIGCFYVATDMGLKYDNWSVGNFEFEIEVGSISEYEAFKPSKACITFKATGGQIEFVTLKVLD